MKVVLYGATGNSGSSILKELVSRGHQVTAVARDTSKLPTTVTAVQDDLSSVDKIASVIAGADVVISAYAPPPADTDALLGVTEREIQAVKRTGNARLIVVGSRPWNHSDCLRAFARAIPSDCQVASESP